MRGLVETGSLRDSLNFVNFKVLSGKSDLTFYKLLFFKFLYFLYIGVLLSWVLTVPAAFGLSAAIFLILEALL
jgi:hypothetical protein